MNLSYKLLYTWNSFPVFIRVALIVAVVSFAGALASILFLYLSKLARQTRAAVKSSVRKDVRQIMLNEIIIPLTNKAGQSTVEYNTERLRSILSKRRYARQVIITEIINFRNVFSGEIADALRDLYLELGLHHRAMEKLSSKDWRTVSSGLVELYRMDIVLGRDTLFALARHEDRYVKEIARWYVIKQSDENPLAILENIHEPILAWEELEILKLFTDKKEFKLPPVSHLLRTSTEPTAVSLGMKLAAHYRQTDAVGEVTRLVQSNDLIVRRDAIRALATLGNADTEDMLVGIYETQPANIKAEILETLGQIGTGRYINFIQEELLRTEEFEIRRVASQALVRQSHFSGRVIDNLLHSSAEQIRQLLKYYLNPITKRHA